MRSPPRTAISSRRFSSRLFDSLVGVTIGYILAVGIQLQSISFESTSYKIIDAPLTAPNTTARHSSSSNLWHEAFTQNFRSSVESLPDQVLRHTIPFFISDKTLLCHDKHKDAILNGHERARSFVELLREALQDDTTTFENLPLLMNIHDDNGCVIDAKNATNSHDRVNVPRLSWTVPSRYYDGTDWCRAFAIPTFDLWFWAKESLGERTWALKQDLYQDVYPWKSKHNKAVWRGSTTYYLEFDNEPQKYTFKDIPRAKLVEMTRDHPNWIDAKFTTILQKFESFRDELQTRTIMADFMPFENQMEYKAILDIDGNSYSARFSRLLCTNSVIIKITPRWAEYFFDELQPMVHYVPASLENLTKVVEYVVDEANSDEMQTIVQQANQWCQKKFLRSTILSDTRKQLEKFQNEIQSLWQSHDKDFEGLLSYITRGDYPFVECWDS